LRSSASNRATPRAINNVRLWAFSKAMVILGESTKSRGPELTIWAGSGHTRLALLLLLLLLVARATDGDEEDPAAEQQEMTNSGRSIGLSPRRAGHCRGNCRGNCGQPPIAGGTQNRANQHDMVVLPVPYNSTMICPLVAGFKSSSILAYFKSTPPRHCCRAAAALLLPARVAGVEARGHNLCQVGQPCAPASVAEVVQPPALPP
jgi:hypothetical protein